MNPSPFFKGVIVTLIALALLVIAIFNNAVYAADFARAPVVERAEEGVMMQTGWFTYPKQDDAVVLYCTHTSPTLLACVVFVVTPKGNGIVLVEGVQASEVSS